MTRRFEQSVFSNLINITEQHNLLIDTKGTKKKIGVLCPPSGHCFVNRHSLSMSSWRMWCTFTAAVLEKRHQAPHRPAVKIQAAAEGLCQHCAPWSYHTLCAIHFSRWRANKIAYHVCLHLSSSAWHALSHHFKKKIHKKFHRYERLVNS